MPSNKPVLAEGEAFVEGRSREVAADLIERAGKDAHLIRTTSFGYIVPSSLVEEQGEESTPVPTEPGDDSTPDPEDENKAPAEFDPSDHTIAEVQAYLADADADERERVLSAEQAGKARKALADTNEGAK